MGVVGEVVAKYGQRQVYERLIELLVAPPGCSRSIAGGLADSPGVRTAASFITDNSAAVQASSTCPDRAAMVCCLLIPARMPSWVATACVYSPPSTAPTVSMIAAPTAGSSVA